MNSGEDALGSRFVAAGEGANITGEGSRTVTQQTAQRYSLCVTNLVATVGGGAVYGEFNVLNGNYYGAVVGFLGAVVQKDGLDLNKGHANEDNDEACPCPVAASGAAARQTIADRAMTLAR